MSIGVTELIEAYEDRGLKCFPISVDKHPFSYEAWKPYRTESKEQRLTRFRRVITQGRPFLIAGMPGEKLIVDLDNAKSFDEFMAGQTVEFAGPIVMTPSGGTHYWHTNGCGLGITHLDWGDILTGDGCYCILPGSGFPADYEKGGKRIHASYEWAPGSVPLHEWNGELPDVPPELLSRLQNGKEKPAKNIVAESKTIPQGMRNTTLTSLAGSMRRHGASEETIREALENENSERCENPLPEREVRAIAASVSRYPPAPPMILECRTDSGNAEFFAHLFGDQLRFDHQRKRWLRWADAWWAPDSTDKVVLMAREAARERQRQASQIENKDQRKSVFDWGWSSESRAKIDAMLALAKSQPPFADAGKDWDADPWLFGMGNGVLDLRTGQLRDGHLEDRITRHSAIAFDPGAAAPRWVRFLFEIFSENNEVTDFVQRAVGYSLTGDTSEQCLFILHGSGANGKSVFLETLRYVLGDYAHNMPFSAIEFWGRAAIPNDIAPLDGPRLVTAAESNEGSRLNEARIKALTGRDKISARFLHKEFFTFTPRCKFWLCVNHLPVVRDDSFAFWRRVRLIPFERQFKGQEADQHLAEKLRAEAQGILAWAVRGCTYWRNHGLQAPAGVQRATQQYQKDSDPLAGFFEECCTFENDCSVRASELYTAYRAWADSQQWKEREILGSTAFGRRMTAKYRKVHDEKGWYYVGIGVQADQLEIS